MAPNRRARRREFEAFAERLITDPRVLRAMVILSRADREDVAKWAGVADIPVSAKDQMQAAARDTDQILQRVSRLNAMQSTDMSSAVAGLMPWLIHPVVATNLMASVVAWSGGEADVCVHNPSPEMGRAQPVFTSAWAAGRVVCRACAAQVSELPRESEENWRCDACGWVVPPALRGSENALSNRLVRLNPVVTAFYGLCTGCEMDERELRESRLAMVAPGGGMGYVS